MYISVLSRYLIRTYLEKLLLVLLVVTAALILSNTFDLLQRIKGIHLRYDIFFQLVFLKTPYLIIELLPLIVMLATFLMHFMLTKCNELFVVWGSGISIYRALLPIILINLAIGLASITLLNPLSTYMLVKFETLESKFTDRKLPYLTLSSLGVMISENYNGENRIYVAKSVVVPEKKMLDVSIFFTDDDNNFLHRIEAKKATFEEGKIAMHNVSIFTSDNTKTYHEEYSVASNLLITNLVDGVTAPDHLNFWKLPETISKLSDAGFPIFKYQLYYSKLLLKPLAMIAYILLAMCFISNDMRAKNRMNHLAFGIFTGLFGYLVSQIFSNILAYNGTSIMLAVFLPIMIVILGSNFAMLHWRRD